ncbi:peptidoglycan editing factor PgeF [Peteryoungia desertarenae]|uniref:Purine nucleoside phosphorylase n=1 Tax=Peteryoungia desertarenae TaxID=1813451 RepID=A0ABX6QRY2_9HYPH|nr:peptidoglycan editing factor PgeF [Peteryoungia desertarenae]QLF70952.1 peptidoglycan editing factor PgeF [Peteryoungia desertarenae]
MRDTRPPHPLTSALLNKGSDRGIRHGFFTRQGGVSTGIYEGLNVGVGSSDQPEHIQENRARVSGWFGLPAAHLATVHQVHSPDVVVIDRPPSGERPKADALVTKEPDVILGVLTADCGPILFADPENRVIGAAHAGWKGALYGVLENTIAAMERLGGQRETMHAVLGPSISRDSYEVGPEFVERFLTTDASYERFFSPSIREGHAMFDLQALTLHRLEQAGIRADHLGICTYADPRSFYSYRRTTHAGEPDYGRQISAIAIMER